MGKPGILFCHLSRSKPYAAGANLMTLIHSFQLLIVTAFAHEKSPAARRKCLNDPLYRVVNAQFMRISTVNSNDFLPAGIFSYKEIKEPHIL